MKDFGRWFAGQSLAAPAPTEPVLSLADQLEAIGLDMHADGSVYGKCCVCDRAICLTDFMTAEEALRDADPADQYCGGSPRCCP